MEPLPDGGFGDALVFGRLRAALVFQVARHKRPPESLRQALDLLVQHHANLAPGGAQGRIRSVHLVEVSFVFAPSGSNSFRLMGHT
jgi:hypothetical protein